MARLIREIEVIVALRNEKGSYNQAPCGSRY